MKSMRILLMFGALAAAGCVPKAAPPPEPRPQPPPQPQPTSAPPPPAADWRDIPLTSGDWVYNAQGGNSQALFGPANSEALFSVRCDRARRQVILSRAGQTSGDAMSIRTTFGARSLPVTVGTEPLPYAAATLSANDSFLDSMVFSRGRFTVAVPGTTMLVIPAWPAPARVIEDCRS